MNNVIIIGSGPAGHTAALYLARANLNPLMLEGAVDAAVVPGGLLTTTKIVENFPGFPQGIDGFELTERFKEQSARFGTRFISETAIKISKSDNFTITTAEGTTFHAKRIIIATGSTPNRLDIPGWDQFWHHGISTCAVCDGGLPCFRGVPIAVVGGGDSACEEALHLTHTASVVYLIHRRGELRASKIMIDRVAANKKIVPIWHTKVIEASGGEHIEKLQLENVITGEKRDLPVNGLFVAIGHTPNSQFVADLVEIDKTGYIVTNERKETSVPGIWAAGDVQDPHYRQAITAAGSGCVAALQVERSLY